MGRSDPAGVEEKRRESYALDELGWPRIEDILRTDPRLLFAVGALEQHGPHLPLGANLLVSQSVVEALSQAHGILRAPPFPYGVTLPGEERFAGVAGLRRKTLHRAVNELLASWEDRGVRELILVTAHRYEPHLDALLMALSSKAETTVIDLRAIPVADLLETDPEAEHGGELETSLLLHLAPERVDRAAIRDFEPEPETVKRYVRGRSPTPPPDSPGSLGRPSAATAEKGGRIFRRYVESLGRQLLEGDRREGDAR